MQRVISSSEELIMFVEFTAEAYSDPEKLFAQMKKDFAFIYTIDPYGGLEDIKKDSYEAVFKGSKGWKMLVLSKKALL